MTLERCEDLKTWTRAISAWTDTQLALTRTASVGEPQLFIPAGQTPVLLYELWERERPASLRSVRFHQIDDVASGAQRGVFRQFFERHLPSYRAQIQWIDRADSSPDLCILGLGLNGHVAFHEPDLPRDFAAGCVRLGERTCQTLKLENGTWGITYGLGTFMRARAMVLIVQGASKREILSRILAREAGLPASLLLEHPNIHVIADREAL